MVSRQLVGPFALLELVLIMIGSSYLYNYCIVIHDVYVNILQSFNQDLGGFTRGPLLSSMSQRKVEESSASKTSLVPAGAGWYPVRR